MYTNTKDTEMCLSSDDETESVLEIKVELPHPDIRQNV